MRIRAESAIIVLRTVSSTERREAPGIDGEDGLHADMQLLHALMLVEAHFCQHVSGSDGPRPAYASFSWRLVLLLALTQPEVG
jgi:hypothetical protein